MTEFMRRDELIPKGGKLLYKGNYMVSLGKACPLTWVNIKSV